MSDDVADHVAIEVAGKAAGIPARTLRYWVASGKLSAIAGKRGKLVSMGEVAYLAALVGKQVGNANSVDGNPATFADEVADTVADRLADTALVSNAARNQLAAIRDEWLAPLVAQLTDQAETIGRLTAERDELRRRAEVAESERSDFARQLAEAQSAPPAAPQPPSEAPTPSAHEEPPPLLGALAGCGPG